MGEHSPVDALIPSILVEYVLGEPVDETRFRGGGSNASGKATFQRLNWVADDAMKAEILACQERNRTMIDDSDASQLWWGEFGVEWIKKNGLYL